VDLDPAARDRHDVVPFGLAVRTWFLISLQTFGGPAGQIAVMQRVLVDDLRWISQRRFQHALSYCMLLPGPEAQQLAVYTGWLLNGTRGGIAAGGLFVLPGMIAMLGLSMLYVAYGDTTAVTAVFLGVAPAVVAIVAQAVTRVGKRALVGPVHVAIAVVAFVCLFVTSIPFPVLIILAGVSGWLLLRGAGPTLHGEPDDNPSPLISDDVLHHEAPSLRRTLRILAIGVPLWVAPIVAVAIFAGPRSVYVDQGLFFSGAALVTFGGAYAVLSYVADRAVELYGWLQPGEMARGLALAESTPGPLIMVVQFVAFLGAYRAAGSLDPWLAGTLAALLTTWVTFLPSFLLVFLGAPSIERLRGNQRLTSALSGVTAAIVGVIANLGVFFAVNTFFDERKTFSSGVLRVRVPEWSTFQPVAFAIFVIAAVLLLRVKLGVLTTLGICAALGMLAVASPLV
jgi:chromate transporter